MVQAIKDLNEDIVCSMDANGRHVNIQQQIVRHSPTGFAWGYGGSGSAGANYVGTAYGFAPAFRVEAKE